MNTASVLSPRPSILFGSLAVAAALAASVSIAPAATAAPSAQISVRGHFTSAVQHRDGTVRVRGVASARRRGAVRLCLAVHGSCVRTVRTSHGHFSALLKRQRPGVRLNLRSLTGPHTHLDALRVRTPGQRVIAIAKKHVGDRYVYGGVSPRTGFDCSGYTLYAYKKADVARLPHNTNTQMHARHMHRIGRKNARPGDLIFYMSGGSSFHVAIFAGHDMQYAAADPKDGVRYQKIWSRHIQFRTNWH